MYSVQTSLLFLSKTLLTWKSCSVNLRLSSRARLTGRTQYTACGMQYGSSARRDAIFSPGRLRSGAPRCRPVSSTAHPNVRSALFPSPRGVRDLMVRPARPPEVLHCDGILFPPKAAPNGGVPQPSRLTLSILRRLLSLTLTCALQSTCNLT